PQSHRIEWDLGYMGTYSADRQPKLDELLVKPARRWRAGRFAIAGPQYPHHLRWPANVEYTPHLAPKEHRAFYNRQRYALNITRADMVAAGWSPSVRLFEAAACATPIISDCWAGIDTLFEPGREILLATSVDDVLQVLRDVTDAERVSIGRRARERVLAEHTAAHRARELESHACNLL